ncbi:hypothetical protein BE21_11505 [Sorangium cellulosum]|uniref:DUF4351 domain-containing protein n=1 Tax=Sorangium cellulosum TaxID=56 RepID=A0A150U120_SORCE|nr:hypothetical protein BE21_11505 [Sorangium cellulosum]
MEEAYERLFSEHAETKTDIPNPDLYELIITSERERFRLEKALDSQRAASAAAQIGATGASILSDGTKDERNDAYRRGLAEGELMGRRTTLLRLVARAGITLTTSDLSRVQGCGDVATLDRWIDNSLSAKTAADVLSLRRLA